MSRATTVELHVVTEGDLDTGVRMLIGKYNCAVLRQAQTCEYVSLFFIAKDVILEIE